MYQNGPGLFGALNDEIPYADLDEGLRQRNVPAPDPPSDEQVGDTNNIHLYTARFSQSSLYTKYTVMPQYTCMMQSHEAK